MKQETKRYLAVVDLLLAALVLGVTNQAYPEERSFEENKFAVVE